MKTMEKITKSSDKVLIDPNEPLILPDGTALVGRVEWFLYALCCLDYQNLPTPMSRIEEFANALITGEVPNIEPQSRAEQFFLAILDGNVSDLPQPQSRSEVLLDKLARGEFDLSDVEPIQSSYELLLAYLIKNGGIGNIDYVLYEFSEAMKTMYNTVEKPFKSLELSGNTLVNCVLEDTENDDYTSFDKDYSGTSFTINGTSEGAIKSAILKGQTLVNLFDGHALFSMSNTVTSYDEGVYTFQAKEAYEGAIAPSNIMTLKTAYKLELNKKYTLFVTQLSGNPCQFGVQSMEVGNKNSTNQNISEPQTHDSRIHKITFTLTSDYSELRLRLNTYQTTQRSIQFKEIMIIEGDYTNVDIPYFEGMQSVKLPVLSATGKNLWDMNKIIKSDFELNKYQPSYYGKEFELKPNTTYTINPYLREEITNTSVWTVFNVINNGNLLEVLNINRTGSNTNNKLSKITFQTGSTGKIGISIYSNRNAEVSWLGNLPFNIQLEEGPVATSYEPFKSNILTTTSKNLFNMNRPYDAITDSQATVVQDTNQITVSSAESGIYVNANFILDKDFFAGKTVTGSCLYESDEKDIGTVQIHYQDGNGDHHYQWIRTPKTFTFPNSFIGDVVLSISANNTDTPQSNTVTVKNIQLELGSTATSYEQYSEGVTLRGIDDMKDELDLMNGELTQRIGEATFRGAENETWGRFDDSAIQEKTCLFSFYGGLPTLPKEDLKMLSDKYIIKKGYGTLLNTDEETVHIYADKAVYFRILKSKLSTQNVIGFKEWLSQNPFTVQYQLATPTTKTVDLNVVDQNNTKIDKIHVFNETTHVNASSDELTPTVNIGKSVSYPTIIKPNTKYTVDLKRNDKPLTVNLGGTEVTFASGETRKVITTPSTLTNDKLSYYGVGAKCNEIMLIEGEVEGNVDYFTGMQSVVMQNQMPILRTVGKNLAKFTTDQKEVLLDSTVETTRTLTLDVDELLTIVNKNVGKRICLAYEVETSEETTYGHHSIDLRPEFEDGTDVWWSTTPKRNGTVYKSHMIAQKVKQFLNKEVFFRSAKGTGRIYNVRIWISDTDTDTTYEAHKTSILSCNEDVVLREIGDVRDTLDLMTGEVTERVGEIVLDGSQDINSWWNTTSTIGVGTPIPTMKNISKLNCDKLPVVSHEAMNNDTYDKDGVASWDNGNIIRFRIEKSKLSTEDVNGVKQYLQSNPITIQYELINKSVKTVDLSVVDQDGNTIPKIKSYEDVTHLEVTVPKQSLLPNVSAEVATDNSKDMSSLTIKYQEISEAQATIQDNIQSQSDEIDTALMATTEIFESILE
jgi:hypothetical protein